MSVELLPHNRRAYENVKRIFESSNRTAVVHPTGTGKSFIALKLIEENKDKKIIYLSPSVPIMNQLKKNIVETGTHCEDLKRITYQKLTAMDEQDREQLQADIIILDEFHHCGAPEWGNAVEQLISNNPNAKILGLSATPMRYFDGEVRDMAEELFDNNVASEMSLEEAIATGVLSEPDYTTGLYEYDEIIKELEEKWQKLSDSEKERNAQEYKESMQQLRTMLDASVKGLPELLENKMTNRTGRYIVYCKNIEDMQKKMQEAQNMFGRVNSEMEIMSISSRDEDVRTNARTIRQFEKDGGDGKLKLLFSVNMLNEGYHLKDLDGVIMMRPTHSPTLYYQQLGRALSVGDGKQPIVIDLVNNIDTIEIIEGFSKSLGEAKTRNPNVNTRNFAISEETRKIKEIVEKIDKLVQRKKDYLTFEEKFELMTEYMRETGEDIKADTKYRGYNIGSMKNNLRQAYFTGTLKIDGELLEKFIASGIIVEEKERIRTSQQEKYEFLMQMVGKSKDDLYHAKMESGLSFAQVKRQLQIDYNRGTLKLTPEQIENLRKNGFLGYSREEQEKMAEEMGLPRKYAVDIVKKYGSYEEFMEQYKKGTIDYDFGYDVFCGYRGVTVSDQEMTEEQKLRYATLARDILKDDFEDGDYIDIDKLKSCIDTIPDGYKKIIEWCYGLNGEKLSYEQIGRIFGVTRNAIYQKKNKALRCIISRKQKNNLKGNVKIKLQQYQSKYKDIQDCIRDVEAIKSYITDENGNPKEEVEDISLKELGFCNYEHYRKDKDVISALIGEKRKDYTYIGYVIAVINSQEEQERIKRIKRIKNEIEKIDIEDMNFSVRTFNCLKRANVNYVSDLVRRPEEDFARIRNFNRKCLEEVKQKLAERGLQLGQEIEIDDETNAEPKKPRTEILLQRCNMLLEEYRGRISRLEEYRREELEQELERYNEARDNYLNRENIFDPNGIVPAVKRSREEERETIKEIDMNTDIEDMDFSVQTFNCLKRGNINTISELVLFTEEDLAKIRNMGGRRLEEVKQKLEEIGLQLRQKTQDMEVIGDESSSKTLQGEYENHTDDEQNSEPTNEDETSYACVPKAPKIEDMTIEELEQKNQDIQRQIQEAKALVEQKKKDELINSIMNGQQELERLIAILASLGISLED